MKDLVKTLIKSPATFIILILIMILALLITLRAADNNNRGHSSGLEAAPVAVAAVLPRS